MKVNQALILRVASPDAGAYGEQLFKSGVADIDQDHIYIQVPIDEQTGAYKHLEMGEQISVHYITDNGQYDFASEVMGYAADVVRLVVIRKPKPEEIQHSQRRKFLRVYAKLELAVSIAGQLQFLAHTSDIGGGGVSFLCDSHIPLKINDNLHCWLLIPERNGAIEHAQFAGEVVRVKPHQAGKQLIMMKFVDIHVLEQQKIIRYVFDKQLEHRKRS